MNPIKSMPGEESAEFTDAARVGSVSSPTRTPTKASTRRRVAPWDEFNRRFPTAALWGTGCGASIYFLSMTPDRAGAIVPVLLLFAAWMTFFGVIGALLNRTVAALVWSVPTGIVALAGLFFIAITHMPHC